MSCEIKKLEINCTVAAKLTKIAALIYSILFGISTTVA
jgi:hypothetical protein